MGKTGVEANGTPKLAPFNYSISKLLILGFLFHVVFIYSVFDCYFTSPVVSGMKSFNVGSSPAKRLVLIVGDGLRADLLFNTNPFPNIPGSPRIVAPHLRSIVENRGAFGISHTRVPTESRPGHVAIIAGMYEDVSAVTKGWKTNPVDFDSVFNQSSATFQFGSPDITPMFTRGAAPGKVKEWCYDAEAEDFTKDATELDLWVLDHLESLLRNATTDPSLDKELRQDKVVFFLHLLGLDTTGHSYRPHSKEYMNNIQVVDSIVKRTEELISSFYGDEETSYVFTADHGMSVIGNHGDGHPDNTRTPIIAWGKGVRGPLPDPNSESHDDYSRPWELSHLYRRDMEQADIAPLMSSLVGIDWPVNSVGVLPDTDPSLPGYLDTKASDSFVARAAFTNAKMILEQYRVKNDIKKSHSIWYSPFKALHQDPQQAPGEADLKTIEALLANGSWTEARRESLSLVKKALSGLHYLQTYDRTLIRTIVTFAYTGWAAFACIYLFRTGDAPTPSGRTYRQILNGLAAAILGTTWMVFFVQKSPWTFYIYVAFPVYFWQQFLAYGAPSIVGRVAYSGYANVILRVALVVICTQAMVLGYTHRSIWSIGLFFIAVVWPLTWNANAEVPATTKLAWGASSLLTAVFPLLPVDKTENLTTILAGGVSIIALASLGLVIVASHTTKPAARSSIYTTFSTQVLLMLLMMLVTASSVRHLQRKNGLPVLNETLGWIILGVASLFPFTGIGYQKTAESRILRYFLGFGPAFVILSISVEGMFYASFTACLLAWLDVERRLRQRPEGSQEGSAKSTALSSYRFQPDDLRIALFFLFFVQIGFFGTGNVASISSFYLAPVYRLIPIFSPFFMTSLLLFKIVVPYVMLGVVFAQLNKALQLPPFSLLLVALAIVDGMTLSFFYQVKDTGSWLEIGQSISFFCITSLLLLWAALICAIGEYLMSGTVTHDSAAKSD
ncbi:GPI ethanolamine phosphate transferase 1 [Coprinopsis cinerea AmutBmut pab1-1]|nr:GPI ethanolamine phosphate transferase 1 [Coprinopsis cinerea AmutBmut pab1-1]